MRTINGNELMIDRLIIIITLSVAVWLCCKPLVSNNVVVLRRARLALGWVTCLQADKPSRYVTSRPCQLSLAIPPWHAYQRKLGSKQYDAVFPCLWSRSISWLSRCRCPVWMMAKETSLRSPGLAMTLFFLWGRASWFKKSAWLGGYGDALMLAIAFLPMFLLRLTYNTSIMNSVAAFLACMR